jgi:uncharacterized protein involved in cysteine biosynthesis
LRQQQDHGPEARRLAAPAAARYLCVAEVAMLAAAYKALSDMLTPPFRAVLLKSVALAIALLVVLGIALFTLLDWLSGSGAAWIEGTAGSIAHTPLVVLGWVFAFALGLGLFAGAIFVMPATTALVASFFADEIADHVEREHYPADQPGRALPLVPAILDGVRTALLSLLVYLCAAPFLLLAGAGVVMFFLATAYLLGREYFHLAAMRFHPVAEAKALRRANATTVFVAGLFIAAFVSIPVVNLATPLFATAFMVHVYKRVVGGSRGALVERP